MSPLVNDASDNTGKDVHVIADITLALLIILGPAPDAERFSLSPNAAHPSYYILVT